jgi:hypothetical protein
VDDQKLVVDVQSVVVDDQKLVVDVQPAVVDDQKLVVDVQSAVVDDQRAVERPRIARRDVAQSFLPRGAIALYGMPNPG